MEIDFSQNVLFYFIAVSKDLVGDQGAAGGPNYPHVIPKQIKSLKFVDARIIFIARYMLYIYIKEKKN